MGISNTTTAKVSERREELAALPTAPNKPIEAGRRVRRQVVVHWVRTAAAAVISLVVARLFGLSEDYWAPVTTLAITQSSLRETSSLSWQRFIGTALGALVGVIVAIQIGPNLLAFGAGVFVLGLLCALVGSDRTAYRFGGVALAIVLLVPRTNSAWHMAFHRFAGVSIGIGVALILTVLWPESEDPQGGMGFVQPNDSVTTGSQERVDRTAVEVAGRKFSPEVMNRLHKVVVFHPLKPEELDEVLEIELGNVQKRMLDSTMRPFLFRITEEGRKFLLQEGTDQRYGGRHLKRAIERHVVNPIARLLAAAQVHQGEVLVIDHYPGEKRLLFRRDTEKCSSGPRIDFSVANSGQLMTNVLNRNSRDET